MQYTIDDFFEEFSDLVRQTHRADHQYFQARLKQWFDFLAQTEGVSDHINWLKSRLTWAQIQSDYMKPSSGIRGSNGIELPSSSEDRLSLYLNVFERMADGELDPVNFSMQYAYGGDKNINSIIHKMLDQLFDPFISELRRYIKRNYDEPAPETVAISAHSVPASDRIVRLNHNSTHHTETIKAIEQVEELVRGVNDIEPEEKELIATEVAAGKSLLGAVKARLMSLASTLVVPLKWIAEKFAGAAVGVAAKAALEKLWIYVPALLNFAKSLL